MSTRFLRPAAIAACLLLLGAIAGTFAWRRHHAAPPSPELATPMLAFAYLENQQLLRGKTLFFNAPAAGFLKTRWKALGLAGSGPEEPIARYEVTLHNPQAWRALDRKERFAAILLVGDPAEFRPLLEHLLQSPDWTLAYLDPTSLIFRRSPAPAWSVSDLAPLKERFKSHSRAEQVMMRVQSAHRLAAIEEISASKALLDEALRLDPQSGPAWTEVASQYAILGQWDRALDASEHAVKADKNYLPALAAKANALFAFGKFNDALALTRRLVVETPGDGQNLYLHAKVTHAAHAYTEEIEVLLKIIAISESNQMPTGSWRIYLAQAYAATGQGEPALAQFEAALKDPTLSDKERSFAEKGVNRLRNRTSVF